MIRTTTIKQFNSQPIDLDKIRAVAGNPELSADEVFDFPPFIIAKNGVNHNRTDITAEGQRAAVNDWVGCSILYKDHKMETDNQIGRIYHAWIEEQDGETVTWGRAFACKTKDPQDEARQKKIKNRQHKEMSCAYEVVKSECSKCKSDTSAVPCPLHVTDPDYFARDLAFKPHHVSFVGDPAVEGAGLVTNSSLSSNRESLRLQMLAADGELFRAYTTQEFCKWYRLNNQQATDEQITTLADKLTAREMITFARIQQSDYQKCIPSGAQQLKAPEETEEPPARSAEEIRMSFKKGI